MNIKLHIERLILDGIPVRGDHKEQIMAAVRTELHSLLATGGVASEFGCGASIPIIRGGSIAAPEVHAPKKLGRQIAAAVHQGIGK
jgi:hypothetical protein